MIFSLKKKKKKKNWCWLYWYFVVDVHIYHMLCFRKLSELSDYLENIDAKQSTARASLQQHIDDLINKAEQTEMEEMINSQQSRMRDLAERTSASESSLEETDLEVADLGYVKWVWDLAGLSVIINSKLHFFFQMPTFFCIFRENFTITYTRTFLETAYVWKERQFFVVGNKLSLAIFNSSQCF